MKCTILDAFTSDQGDETTWSTLRTLGTIARFDRSSPAEVIQRAAGCTAIFTNKALVSAEAINELPDLRYIGVMATGTNNVDLAMCKKRNIVVSNVPGYSTESVAQLVFALALHIVNDVAGHHQKSIGNGWASCSDFSFFTKPLYELAGKKILIIGSGAIGSSVARIATAFGMTVIAGKVPGSSRTERVALAEALPKADIISLHCPLTDQTKHLVNRDFLRQCKTGAILINTGRGPLIDEVALSEALGSGKLAGAGLDVLSKEPPERDHPLLRSDAPWASRLVITPHIAWGTVEARQRLVEQVVANFAAFRDGTDRNRVA